MKKVETWKILCDPSLAPKAGDVQMGEHRGHEDWWDNRDSEVFHPEVQMPGMKSFRECQQDLKDQSPVQQGNDVSNHKTQEASKDRGAVYKAVTNVHLQSKPHL